MLLSSFSVSSFSSVAVVADLLVAGDDTNEFEKLGYVGFVSRLRALFQQPVIELVIELAMNLIN